MIYTQIKHCGISPLSFLYCTSHVSVFLGRCQWSLCLSYLKHYTDIFADFILHVRAPNWTIQEPGKSVFSAEKLKCSVVESAESVSPLQHYLFYLKWNSTTVSLVMSNLCILPCTSSFFWRSFFVTTSCHLFTC